MNKRFWMVVVLVGLLFVQMVSPFPHTSAAPKETKEHQLHVKVHDEEGFALTNAVVYLYGTEVDANGVYPVLWSGTTDRKGIAQILISNISYNGGHHQQQYSLKISAPGREIINHDFTIAVWDAASKKLSVTGPSELDFKLKKEKSHKDLQVATRTHDPSNFSISPLSTVIVRQVGSAENLGWQKIKLAYMDNAEGTNTTLEFKWISLFQFKVAPSLKFTFKDGSSVGSPAWQTSTGINYSWESSTQTEKKWVRSPSQTAPIWACGQGRVESSWWEKLTYMPVNGGDWWDWVVTDTWQEVKTVQIDSWSTLWDSVSDPHYFTWNGYSQVAPSTTSETAWDTTTQWKYGVDLRWKFAQCGLDVTTVKNSNTSLLIDNEDGNAIVYLHWTPDFKWPRLSPVQ